MPQFGRRNYGTTLESIKSAPIVTVRFGALPLAHACPLRFYTSNHGLLTLIFNRISVLIARRSAIVHDAVPAVLQTGLK